MSKKASEKNQLSCKCQDCGHEQKESRSAFHLASPPRCIACGGLVRPEEGVSGSLITSRNQQGNKRRWNGGAKKKVSRGYRSNQKQPFTNKELKKRRKAAKKAKEQKHGYVDVEFQELVASF